jgi:uncharacterized lipoprotein YehR (DUF1307 family)
MNKKRKKNEPYFPSEVDMVNVYMCVKTARLAFSVEKCDKGFHVVKYGVDDNGIALKNTISYKRIDTTKEDTPSNRVVYQLQADAEEAMFDMYGQAIEFFKTK